MSGCPFHLQKSSQAIDVPGDPARDYAFLAEVYGDKSDQAGLRQAVFAAARERGEPAPLDERELTAAGRIAWRNHARCIGRLYWRTLIVRDRRNLVEPDAIAAELAAHLRAAQNGGSIRSILTVFAPAAGTGRRGPRIWNQQLCGYAGYRSPDGQVLGDPRNAAFTSKALELGWTPPAHRSAFDLLPWILSGPDGRPHLFPIPDGLVQEVVINHPDHPGFAELGLRWYAVPAIADMRLRIAGTDFGAAPFNGWYMGTEIAARNLADTDRYNLLPEVARCLGLDTRRARTLWQDRALVELNRAVLHSYERDQVKLVDHHTASEEFMHFLELERKAGREVSARWDWIVPPLSPATTRVFHTPMREFAVSPDFLPADQSPAF
jgi:nitric-oxide synthase